jgi:cell division GTPase FtsZ
MGARISDGFMDGVRVTAIVTGVKSPSLFGNAEAKPQQEMVASSATLPEDVLDKFM